MEEEDEECEEGEEDDDGEEDEEGEEEDDGDEKKIMKRRWKEKTRSKTSLRKNEISRPVWKGNPSFRVSESLISVTTGVISVKLRFIISTEPSEFVIIKTSSHIALI